MSNYLDKQSKHRVARFKIAHAPRSCDPLDHDLFVHHEIFKSVQSTIVSQYKIGGFTGVLSKSWTVSRDQKNWVFQIRDGLSFASGTPLTAEIIQKSWTRLAYLLKRNNSKSEFFDNLVGIDQLSALNSHIPGLRAERNSLVVAFDKPVPKLLELLGFGLYAVVNPSDYDQNTGQWIDARSCDSSGFYKIEKWDDGTIILSSRDSFIPELQHKNIVRKWHIFWKNPENLQPNIDLASGGAVIEGGPNLTNLRFYQGASNRIAYLQCFSWSKSESPFFNKQKRKYLRHLFFKAFQDLAGVKTPSSFFPLTMSGIQRIEDSRLAEVNPFPANTILQYALRAVPDPMADFVYKALETTGRLANIKTQAVQWSESWFDSVVQPFQKNYSVDIGKAVTAILINDPRADIKFMFESKDGIMLPDPSGKVKEILKEENFDPQLVNAVLWEDSIIWPIAHFSDGIWASKELDLSQLNLLNPPIELNWIGWN